MLKDIMKTNAMAQWMNIFQNNILVNRLLYEKSGAILLVLVGLMAGRLVVRQKSCRFEIPYGLHC